MIKVRQGSFARFYECVRGRREHLTLKGKLVHTNLYRFTCFPDNKRPIIFEVSEVGSWTEAEHVLRAEFMETVTEQQLETVSVGGEALDVEPNGALCLVGPCDVLARMIAERKAVPPPELGGGNTTENELRVYRLEDYATDTLCAHLDTLFLNTKGAYPKGDTKESHGEQRIRVAAEYLYKHYSDTKDLGFMVMRERDRYGEFEYTLPGGKRMLCESSLDCAKREFREETGIDLAKFDAIKPEFEGPSERMIIYILVLYR
jgi:hypothetical protein